MRCRLGWYALRVHLHQYSWSGRKAYGIYSQGTNIANQPKKEREGEEGVEEVKVVR